MTGSDTLPLSDAELDRLLGAYVVPDPAADLADRIVAEAARADRVRPLVAPVPRRAARRPWARRNLVIGIIAINLFAAGAIAAVFGGGGGLARLSAISAHIVHAVSQALPHRQPPHPETPIRARPIAHLPVQRPAEARPIAPLVSAPPMRPFLHEQPRESAAFDHGGPRPPLLAHRMSFHRPHDAAPHGRRFGERSGIARQGRHASVAAHPRPDRGFADRSSFRHDRGDGVRDGRQARGPHAWPRDGYGDRGYGNHGFGGRGWGDRGWNGRGWNERGWNERGWNDRGRNGRGWGDRGWNDRGRRGGGPRNRPGGGGFHRGGGRRR